MLQLILHSAKLTKLFADHLTTTVLTKVLRRTQLITRVENDFRKQQLKSESKLQKQMKKYFHEQREVALHSAAKDFSLCVMVVKTPNTSGWYFPRADWNRRLAKDVRAFMEELVEEYGPTVVSQMKYGIGGSFEMAFDISNPEVQEFLDAYSIRLAEEINTTTNAALRVSVSAGYDAGETMGEIADRVAGVYDAAEGYRSLLIARTETVRGMNYAAEAVYQQSGVVEGKEWLVTEDDRTCEMCLEMSEQVRALGDTFADKGDSVAGVELGYEDIVAPPLHPNCRCCLVPVIKKEE